MGDPTHLDDWPFLSSECRSENALHHGLNPIRRAVRSIVVFATTPHDLNEELRLFDQHRGQLEFIPITHEIQIL